MGNHGYSQVSVSLDGCFVSLGIIVPSLLFVVVLVVSPVRFILSTLVGCFAYPSFSHSPAQAKRPDLGITVSALPRHKPLSLL
jgi:hypothetical protein